MVLSLDVEAVLNFAQHVILNT